MASSPTLFLRKAVQPAHGSNLFNADTYAGTLLPGIRITNCKQVIGHSRCQVLNAFLLVKMAQPHTEGNRYLFARGFCLRPCP